MKFNKIAIIGVGLIGGSIGLAIRRRGLAKDVIGVFRRASTLKKALEYNAVTKGTMNIKDAVLGAELVILAAPVRSIPSLASEVIKYAKAGTVITDVGSTKAWIVNRIEKMIGRSPSIFFVGSHPMAGSEHAGVEFARPDLLEGSPCIVTKTNKTDSRALIKVVNFWKSLGAKVEIMSPASHDRSVSFISHLPHVVGFSLAGAVPEKEMRYAAEGFKDTTRVASSDALLWADIFLTNRKEILRSSRIFERYYRKLIKFISRNKYSELVGFLERTKAKRDRWQKRQAVW
ncbi:MAG: prephenate dehydrogenase [Candidatus Omnitrophota bacterium]|nr:prephenate dehydrogenase [Candidatus Omnitrophota bacterium]